MKWLKKEVKIAKEKKNSKKRILILFLSILFFIFIFMLIWGAIVHKKTGYAPNNSKINTEMVTF
jgi:cytoskeletal protein RodZ